MLGFCPFKYLSWAVHLFPHYQVCMIICLRYASYHSDTRPQEPLMRGSSPLGEKGLIPLLTVTLKTLLPADSCKHLHLQCETIIIDFTIKNFLWLHVSKNLSLCDSNLRICTVLKHTKINQKEWHVDTTLYISS
jgi:hypothetical protein